MKASELMIGDWIQWYFDDGEYHPEKILRLDGNDIPCEPIPLTEEILKANGFKKINSQRWDYGCFDTDVYIKVNPKKNMIHVNGRYANCNLYYHSFIHELQHSLRICGLNELADNFKVK